MNIFKLRRRVKDTIANNAFLCLINDKASLCPIIKI